MEPGCFWRASPAARTKWPFIELTRGVAFLSDYLIPQGFVQFWCTNKAANLCVFGRPSEDKSELVVAAFDPLGGPGKELVRIPLEAGSSADIGFDYSWQLSPDGSQIGIVKRYGNQIRLVPLGGGQTITIKGYPDLWI